MFGGFNFLRFGGCLGFVLVGRSPDVARLAAIGARSRGVRRRPPSYRLRDCSRARRRGAREAAGAGRGTDDVSAGVPGGHVIGVAGADPRRCGRQRIVRVVVGRISGAGGRRPAALCEGRTASGEPATRDGDLPHVLRAPARHVCAVRGSARQEAGAGAAQARQAGAVWIRRRHFAAGDPRHVQGAARCAIRFTSSSRGSSSWATRTIAGNLPAGPTLPAIHDPGNVLPIASDGSARVRPADRQRRARSRAERDVSGGASAPAASVRVLGLLH